MKKIPTVRLAGDYAFSRIIKGGWQLAGGHGVVERERAIDDMFAFVEAGITTFDCADIYTGVEELIGVFLKEFEKKYGKKEREKLRVHTKFVPDLAILPTITQEDVERIIDRSLMRLGVDQLDMVQYHWWDYAVPKYVQVAKHLRTLQDKGKIRFISITNFDIPHLQEILDSGVRVVAHQVQYSVLDHRPEHGMADFCKKNDIQLLCYGTIAGGFLSERYLGVREPCEPLENRSLTKYKLIIDEFGGWDLFQELLKILKKIGEKHGVSIANVANRYILEKPQVAGLIVGARNAEHLASIGSTFTFELDKQDIRLIDSFIAKTDGLEGDTYALERVKGGKHAGIMKYNLNRKE